eukprot:scaffold86253_cov66-Phaeocystis_antarctica.AAC.7
MPICARRGIAHVSGSACWDVERRSASPAGRCLVRGSAFLAPLAAGPGADASHRWFIVSLKRFKRALVYRKALERFREVKQRLDGSAACRAVRCGGGGGGQCSGAADFWTLAGPVGLAVFGITGHPTCPLPTVTFSMLSFVVRKSLDARVLRGTIVFRPQGIQVSASGVAKTLDGRSPSTVTPNRRPGRRFVIQAAVSIICTLRDGAD